MLLRRAGIALFALVLAVWPAPAVQAAPPGPPPGATLRVALSKDIDSLNPFLGYSQSSTEIFRLIYPTLTTYRADNFEPTPELADHWQVSPDHLTWTFHIRDGVHWSDGKPVTARDAAYTYNRMLHDPAASTANGNYVANFAAVTAPDAHTLRIRTKSPQATMLALDIPIVPQHVWSHIRDIASYTNEHTPLVDSGPFHLTEYVPQQRVTLRANPHYWRGPAHIAQLQYLNYKNSDAAVQALRKGEIDLVSRLTPAQYNALANEPNIQRVRGQGRRFYEILVNPGATDSTNTPIGSGDPALADVRVRRALDHAIDRRTLVNRVFGGYAQIGGGYLPPIFAKWHWRPPPQQRRRFDPAAANRMLEEAGYRRGPDGQRHTPQGRPLHLRFMLHGSEASDAQVGQYVQRWLGDLGIPVTLEPVSDSQVNDRTVSGDFDLAVSGYAANPDPDYVLGLQTCAARPDPSGKGATPDSFLCDAEYDRLYQRQRADFNTRDRIATVKRMQQRLYSQATTLIPFYENQLEAYRSDRYRSFTTQPANMGVITGQQGFWGYYGAEPTEKAVRGDTTNYPAVAATILGVVAGLGGIAGLTSWRRHATADRRE